jgi:tRNA-2-methylthio-N6-dimethylallyladenosine synthase
VIKRKQDEIFFSLIHHDFIHYLELIGMNKKNLYIQTLGCQMNVYDSERIAHLLASRNYQLVEDPSQADMIFLNTCSVREKAEKKVYSALGRFFPLKKKNPRLIIGVGGCVAQQEGERILQRLPLLDFVLGTKEIHRLPALLDDLERFGKRGIAVKLNGRVNPYESIPFLPLSAKITSFITIMQGCDNFCSYCIVPFLRGKEVSRPSQELLREMRTLSNHGVKEVTLLGQNVNSYGNGAPGELNFVELLKAVQDINGIERIRFITSHPKDLSDALIHAFANLSKLCEHIHLPLQSGSNAILKRMNRGYQKEEYLEKIERLRQVCPEISITTDFIVGFPGEQEEDFQKTLEVAQQIEFDDFFSFKYSDRPYTQAMLFEDQVPEEIRQKRLEILQSLQVKITSKRNKAWEGREVEVLVEGQSKGNPLEKMGRTRNNRIVNFSGDQAAVGSLVRVQIQKAYAHSLRGKFLSL